jgi:hypothetical protein
MKSSDKVWHGLTCFAITLIAFAVLTSTVCIRDRLTFTTRLVWASIFSLTIGVAKEVSDVFYDAAPWCRPSCDADFRDIIADIGGIVAAIIILSVTRYYVILGQAISKDTRVIGTCNVSHGDDSAI